MTQHAVRTALALYESGTYTLEAAARHAGQRPEGFRHALRTLGVDVDEPATETGRRRTRVAAD